MAKRKPKLGYVYLLKSQSEDGYYKYGATTLTPEKRCKRVNYEYKGKYDFKVIASFLSRDCFGDEHNIAVNIIECGMGIFGEVININGAGGGTIFPEIKNEKLLINRFLTLGKVLV